MLEMFSQCVCDWRTNFTLCQSKMWAISISKGNDESLLASNLKSRASYIKLLSRLYWDIKNYIHNPCIEWCTCVHSISDDNNIIPASLRLSLSIVITPRVTLCNMYNFFFARNIICYTLSFKTKTIDDNYQYVDRKKVFYRLSPTVRLQ